MTFENTFGIIAIAILFIYGMPLLQFLTLLYYSFRYADFQEIDKEEIEPSVLEIMKPSEDFLFAKGFSRSHALRGSVYAYLAGCNGFV